MDYFPCGEHEPKGRVCKFLYQADPWFMGCKCCFGFRCLDTHSWMVGRLNRGDIAFRFLVDEPDLVYQWRKERGSMGWPLFPGLVQGTIRN